MKEAPALSKANHRESIKLGGGFVTRFWSVWTIYTKLR